MINWQFTIQRLLSFQPGYWSQTGNSIYVLAMSMEQSELQDWKYGLVPSSLPDKFGKAAPKLVCPHILHNIMQRLKW